MKQIRCIIVSIEGYEEEDFNQVLKAIKLIRNVIGAQFHINDDTGIDQINCWAYKQKWLNDLAQDVMNRIINEKGLIEK